jgi:methionyl-tRNA formyltransferase
LILPRAILDAPTHGCLNVHASLLPRWRGAAPIHRAILAGDATTGVCIMGMEAGLDTGPVLLRDETSIAEKTAGILTAELSAMGARLMVETLAKLSSYLPQPQPDAGVTYAAKIEKTEARIDLTQNAAAIERQVRAFNPVPGAFIEVAGERIKLLAVDVVTDASASPGTVIDDQLTIACADGAIRPTVLQRAGRSAMEAADLLRGFSIPVGTVL